VNVEECTFLSCTGDALVLEHASGSVAQTTCRSVQGTAVKVLGSAMTLAEIRVSDCDQKGLEVAAESRVVAKRLSFEATRVGVVCTDLSHLRISRSEFTNVRVALAAYMDRLEFGPCTVEAGLLKTRQVGTGLAVAPPCELRYNGFPVRKPPTDVKGLVARTLSGS
jgi:hypothetical protein